MRWCGASSIQEHTGGVGSAQYRKSSIQEHRWGGVSSISRRWGGSSSIQEHRWGGVRSASQRWCGSAQYRNTQVGWGQLSIAQEVVWGQRNTGCIALPSGGPGSAPALPAGDVSVPGAVCGPERGRPPGSGSVWNTGLDGAVLRFSRENGGSIRRLRHGGSGG